MPRVVRVPWLPVFEGFTPCPWLVLVRLDASVGLVQHEIRHTQQMRRDGWVRWWARYIFSRKWRLAYESDAYAVSVRHGDSLDECARWLASKYFLGITQDRARAEIVSWPA